ncbi:MAG: M48 family metalloprotease [Mycobacterium leprae]
MVLLSGVFVGEWIRFGAQRIVPGLVGPAVWWELGVPVLALAATVVLALAHPAWMTRRYRLVPLAADDPLTAPACRRFADLVRDSGLRRVPQAVGSSTDAAETVTFGRPGRYRVRISPAMTGVARRKPDRFDAVIRHELAHIRAHDVLLSYLALYTWRVMVPVLVVPLVLRLVVLDLSLVPDYLWRATVLGVVTYAVRAQLLRCREHYADLRAAAVGGDAAPLLAVLALRRDAVSHRPCRAWRANHPSPEARAQALADSLLLARPATATLAGAGFAAGAGISLLERALIAAGWTDTTGPRDARTVMFALLGAVVAAECARSARYAPGLRVRNAFAVPLLAMMSTVVIGSALSVGMSGLVLGSIEDAAAAVLVAVVTAAALVVLAVLGCVAAARPRFDRLGGVWFGRLMVAVGMLIGVTASRSAVAPATLIADGLWRFVVDDLPYVVIQDGAAALLAASLAVLAVVVCDRWALARGIGFGVLAAVSATAIVVLVRWRVGEVRTDDAAVRLYEGLLYVVVVAVALAAIVAAAGVALGGIMPAGLAAVDGTIAFAVALIVGSLGMITALDVFGARYGAADVVSTLNQATSLAVGPVTVLVAALALMFSRAGSDPCTRSRATLSLLTRTALGGAVPAIGLALVAVGLVPTWVSGSATSSTSRSSSGAIAESAMSRYLANDLPVLVMARYAAASAGQQAEWFPQVSVGHDLRSRVLPLYDRALAQGRGIARIDYVADTPAVTRLHAAYVTFIEAERVAFAADADVADHPDTAQRQAVTTAWETAHTRYREWQQLWTVATASVPRQPAPLPSLSVSAKPGLGASRTPSRAAPTPSITATGWAGQAEAVCARVYGSRGPSPHSRSGRPDDELAVFYSWEATLVTRAVDGLRALGEAPPDGATLVARMSYYADLSAEAAPLVAAHPNQSRMMEIMTKQSALTKDVVARAAALGTPSCGRLVNI